MDAATLAPQLEKLIGRITSGKNRASVDTLPAAASGDVERLGDALWQLVRDGKGGLVGQERAVLAMLTPGHFDGNDFVSLLRQLKAANLFWFEQWTERVDGLAYYGWSKELEVMLDKLLASATDRTPLEWADVSEPAGSALLFALARRGLIQAAAMPADALHRFGQAYLWRGSWPDCTPQFNGWERVWDHATFARAVFADVGKVKEVGLYPATLDPLVAHATPAQISLVVEKMIWPDQRTTEWLASRGKAIVPFLEQRTVDMLRDAKKGHWISARTGRHVGALARIRAQDKLTWPESWIPLAKAMLRHDTTGLRDVLDTVDPAIREEMLLEHLQNKENWRDKLWPLQLFPTKRIADALEKLICETPKAEGWDFEREPLFKTLGAMGDDGQQALEKMLDDPSQIEGAIAVLDATKARAIKTMPLLDSKDETVSLGVLALWQGLSEEDRLDLVDQHSSALRPDIVADLLAGVHHHPRTIEIARRLADVDEAHALRQFCLSRPGPLPALIEAMAAVPVDALNRAKTALNPMFAQRSGDSFDLNSFNVKERLAQFGPDDLPAILRATACRMSQRWSEVETLCKHFWPARPEIPWVAVYWWSLGDHMTLAAAERTLGTHILEPLRARIETGHIRKSSWYFVIGIFARHDPAGSFDFFARFADDPSVSRHVEDAMVASLEAGSAAAREWLAKALGGKQRELALEVLNRHADPQLLPALESLKKQKLSAKLTRLLENALAAQKTRGPSLVRGTKALQARAVHKMDGVIESLHLAQDGKTLCAHAAGTVSVWKGKHQTEMDKLGNVRVELSLDGKHVLVVDEFEVRAYDAWESMKKPCSTLNPDDGLGLVVPMPGGRAFTLCAAHNAYTPLTLWDLDTGKEKVHKISGFPVHVALIDDERYVLGDMNGKITIRQLDTGKVTGKLQGWSNHDGDGICMVASGNGGKGVATLFMDGSLMIWDISGSKVKASRHLRAAPLAIAADPGSSWIVTAGVTDVRTWKDGQPARALDAAGSPAQGRGSPFEGAGLAMFVRPNVVAVGGQCVDLWDLERNVHLGQWDKPITTMATAAGKLVVGDAEGTIWELNVD